MVAKLVQGRDEDVVVELVQGREDDVVVELVQGCEEDVDMHVDDFGFELELHHF